MMKLGRTLLFLGLLLGLSSVAQAEFTGFPDRPEGPIQLEILLAAPSGSSIESAFGHIGMRLKFTEADGKNQDWVLSFNSHDLEDRNAGALKRYAKTIVGFYDTLLVLEDFQNFIKRNAITDNRAIRRLILPSSPEISEKLFLTLKHLEQGNIQFKKYTFLSQNCALSLYEFLGMIGYFVNPRASKMDFVVAPFQFINAAIRPVFLGLVELPQIQTTFSRLASIQEKLGVKVTKETPPLGEILKDRLSEVNTTDLQILTAFDWTATPGFRTSLLQHLKHRGIRKLGDVVEILGYRDYPIELYQLCSSEKCAQDYKSAIADSFSPAEQARLHAIAVTESRRSPHLIYGPSLMKTPQARHLQLTLGQATSSILRPAH